MRSAVRCPLSAAPPGPQAPASESVESGSARADDFGMERSGSNRRLIAMKRFPVLLVTAMVVTACGSQPGDIIATGTTAGVGMTSGKLLRPGDVTTATIDGIGTLVNTFVAEE